MAEPIEIPEPKLDPNTLLWAAEMAEMNGLTGFAAGLRVKAAEQKPETK